MYDFTAEAEVSRSDYVIYVVLTMVRIGAKNNIIKVR